MGLLAKEEGRMDCNLRIQVEPPVCMHGHRKQASLKRREHPYVSEEDMVGRNVTVTKQWWNHILILCVYISLFQISYHNRTQILQCFLSICICIEFVL